MKRTLHTGAILALSTCSIFLAGCGGGNGTGNTAQGNLNTTADGTSRGALAMQINFPSGKSVKASRASTQNRLTRIAGFSNGNIPDGTQAVKVEVVSTSAPETSLALPQVITSTAAQTNGNVTGPVNVRFSNLPVGNVRVRATAYPDISAKLTPIAVGTSDVAIAANATANAQVALALTIDHIALTPTTLSLNFDPPTDQATLMATPMTQDNKPLRMALQVTSDRPDVISIKTSTPPPNTPAETLVYSVQTISPTFATLPATATITFAEPNSGKTVTATATVSEPPGR